MTVQVLQFVTTVVMSRLLTPGQYGLVAIILAFNGFAWIFTDLGLGAALIHRTELDEEEVTTAFWLNLLSGLALTGLFVALAVPIADLYAKPELVGLVTIGSLAFTLSMSTVPLALLQRDLRFQTIAKAEVGAAILSSIVGITCARLGLGAVSLVLASLATSLFSTVFVWLSTGWWPKGLPSMQAVKSLWSYSGSLVGFNIINYWSRNLDNLVIGKVSGPAALAFYARGYNLMMLPVSQVSTIVGRVLFPTLARMQGDADRLKRAYLRSLTSISALSTPLGVGIAAAAPSFVTVVYGHRWDRVAPLLSILALSVPAQVVSATLGPLYQALGRTRSQLRRGAINMVVTVAAIGIGIFWGPTGVSVAVLIKFYVLMPFTAAGAWKHIALTPVTVARNLRATWTCSAVMGGVVLLVAHTVHAPSWAILTIQIVTGLLVYLFMMWLIGSETLRSMSSILPARLGHVMLALLRSTPKHRAKQSA